MLLLYGWEAAAKRVAVSCAAGGRRDRETRRHAAGASKLRRPPIEAPEVQERQDAGGKVRSAHPSR